MTEWKCGVTMLLTAKECIPKYTQIYQPEVSIYVYMPYGPFFFLCVCLCMFCVIWLNISNASCNLSY